MREKISSSNPSSRLSIVRLRATFANVESRQSQHGNLQLQIASDRNCPIRGGTFRL